MGKILRTKNNTAVYLIIFLVVIVAFFLLGGDTWIRGLSHGHGSRSAGLANLQWTQILISMAIGFLLGLLVARRKW